MMTRALMIISFLALGLSACNYKQGGSSASTTAPSIAIVTGAATQHSMAFSPNPFTVSAGTPVVWSNSDSVNHTVTSDNSTFDSGQMSAGQTFTYTFTTPGTYTYHCGVHPSMTGTVIVQ